ncbi:MULTISPECIES: hypothetical protein [unclassified Rhodococcus (in: high G+C Gram-positive bacteria)]|uniref:hypothetical protein n=1 Tax=unclassified Rhodococcus (in: high G+C Gram-positive bacteria) TaxID=192944 RepID=UPI001B541D51|nr:MULTISPECIES: hypothetical protein [unclassified Rhodococcus (in: high G+C Gram-positive bacteria)]MBP1162116.1 hypothetical protein [Rhodococcus sp. PvR099]
MLIVVASAAELGFIDTGLPDCTKAKREPFCPPYAYAYATGVSNGRNAKGVTVNEDRDDIRDDARTARPHAGEAVIDTRSWVGYAVVAAGVVLMALCLVAAGYGFEGWAWISGVTGLSLFVAGVALVVLEHRRIRSAPHDPLTRG